MIKPRTHTQSGFIALMSAIIISVVLLLMITNLSLTGFYGRFNILDAELKEQSLAFAEACADTALLKLANNSSYLPPIAGDPINVDGVPGDDCLIKSISGGDTIGVESNYRDYITKVEVVINPSDISIISWVEKP